MSYKRLYLHHSIKERLEVVQTAERIAADEHANEKKAREAPKESMSVNPTEPWITTPPRIRSPGDVPEQKVSTTPHGEYKEDLQNLRGEGRRCCSSFVNLCS